MKPTRVELPPDPGRPPGEGTHVVRQSQIVRWLGTLTVFKTDARTARNDVGAAPDVSSDLGGGFPDVRSPADRYELLGEYARGGMGVILKARDRVIGRELAMKVPVGGPGWDDTAEGRFLREARTAAAVARPSPELAPKSTTDAPSSVGVTPSLLSAPPIERQ